MSGQVSRGSAGEYQADERAGVAELSWRVSGRWAGRCRAAQLADSAAKYQQNKKLQCKFLYRNTFNPTQQMVPNYVAEEV